MVEKSERECDFCSNLHVRTGFMRGLGRVAKACWEHYAEYKSSEKKPSHAIPTPVVTPIMREQPKPTKHTPEAEPLTTTVEERRAKDKQKLKDLKGINDEIAEAILNHFGTYDEFKKGLIQGDEAPGRRRLLEISGIGKVRADSIIRQLREEI